uniref:Uncharacterized protein n=1 Tax=Chlorocebus sabaeus TaxID=60711 RepID=A0A0D9SBV8_CHLSB
MERRWLSLRSSSCRAPRLNTAWGMRSSPQATSSSSRNAASFLRLFRATRRAPSLCRLSLCRWPATSVTLAGTFPALLRRDNTLSCFSSRRLSRVAARASSWGKSPSRCSSSKPRSPNTQSGTSRSSSHLTRITFRWSRRKTCKEKGSLVGEWSKLSSCKCTSCDSPGGKVISQMASSRSDSTSLSSKMVSGSPGSMQRASSSRPAALRCSFCRSFSGVHSWLRLSCFRRLSLTSDRKTAKRLE